MKDRLDISIVDSHTGGEPTRVIVAGGPDLGTGNLNERVERFRQQHDDFRKLVTREPRGTEVLIGALLCEPQDPENECGVIFFNNVGYLGMCGHGTIGLIATLRHLGRIGMGEHSIETPVGVVNTTLHQDGMVSLTNVESYRYRTGVELQLDEDGKVVGDIAWGGNWFFLVTDHEHVGDSDFAVEQKNISNLQAFCQRIRDHLDQHQITGENEGQIDHIEIFGPARASGADSKNFVLCPGGEFDRSPCGTGTSAKVAALYDDHKIKPGEVFRQESIIGSVFEATIQPLAGNRVLPTIKGSAHIYATSTLHREAGDPFPQGIEL